MQSKETPLYSGLFVQYNAGKEFIMEMKKLNPLFNPSDFQYIVQLAYPIAFIEVEALERTKEDFPFVEKAVLKMCKSGYFEPSIIAHALGLSESYIRKIIRLLLSYGHINENGITELGMKSLEQNASIKKNKVKQKIQVDGVTAEPVDIRDFITENVMRKPAESGIHVAHLEPVAGIEKSRLTQIITSNYTDYVDKGEYSLHTNVESVESARFVGIKYARTFYLETPAGEMAILCKSYNATSKKVSDRFKWRPLFASNREVLEKCGFNSDGFVANNMASSVVNDLKYRISSRRNKTDVEVADMLSQLYNFDWRETELIRENTTVLNVTSKSFKGYDKFILKVLESLADDKVDYIVLEELFGEYILLETEDEDLLKLANEYKEKSKEVGRTYIMNLMENAFEKEQGNIIHVLRRILNNIEIDKE